MIIVRQMQEHEAPMVADLIQNAMRKAYHCDAYALPKLVFICVRSGELVGAIGLSLSSGEPFPVETIYQLDYGSFPDVFDRKCIVQLGRWVTNVPDLSEVLIYGAVSYALRHGCRWGIGETKPKVARRFLQMRIRLFPFFGAPMPSRVSVGIRPYYLLPPMPSVWAISLFEAESALREKVACLVARGDVVIQLNE
jgi:hypothetical protein